MTASYLKHEPVWNVGRLPFIVVVALALLAMPFQWVEAETLVNKDGKKIDVEIRRKDQDKVWFTLKGKSTLIEYEINSLSPQSQKFLKTWKPVPSNNFELKLTTGKRNRFNKHNDIDDRTYELNPQLLIKNRDSKLSTSKGKVYILFFGKPAKYRKLNCLLHREVIELRILEPNESLTLSAKQKITFNYDDVDNGEVFGAKYRGHLIIIVDDKGKEVFRKGVPRTAYDSSFETFEALKVGYAYPKTFLGTNAPRIRLR